jgi:demethoxyubiquinone hydroxylase (CLK1/Coq7/Cat5 family)
MTADGLMSKSEIIAYLDEYSAGERTGERLFHGWVATCKTASLRGALRMMEQRERSHADLLAERVKELGGKPTVSPDGMAADFVAYLSATDKTDAEKLREFMRLAPPEQVFERLNKQVARLAADPESQSLVRAIVDDEHSTLRGLQAAMESIPAVAA